MLNVQLVSSKFVHIGKTEVRRLGQLEGKISSIFTSNKAPMG